MCIHPCLVNKSKRIIIYGKLLNTLLVIDYMLIILHYFHFLRQLRRKFVLNKPAVKCNYRKNNYKLYFFIRRFKKKHEKEIMTSNLYKKKM